MEKTHIVMVTPPEPFLKRLERLMLKLNSKSRYDASEALKYKPHVTLKSLGKIKDEDFKKAVLDIIGITEELHPFPLFAEGLRFYGSNPLFKGIYIPVKKTPPLINLHKALVSYLGKYSDGKDRSFKEMDNYNPHITLVGTDISDRNLERAKRKLRGEEYSYEFLVSQLTLVRHSEEREKPFFYWHMDFGLKPKLGSARSGI